MSNQNVNPKHGEKLINSYVINGKDGEVKHLVYHRHSPKDGEVVVYVDHALELD